MIFCKICLLEASRCITPLRYNICRGISCFDPEYIASRQFESQNVLSCLRTTLAYFQERNWLTPKKCDKIEADFKALMSRKAVTQLCKTFQSKQQRLDDFWMSIISEQDNAYLNYLVKIVLLLSKSW